MTNSGIKWNIVVGWSSFEAGLFELGRVPQIELSSFSEVGRGDGLDVTSR